MRLLMSRIAPLSDTHASIIGPNGFMISKQFDGFVQAVKTRFGTPPQVWTPGPDRQIWWTCILGDTRPRD